MHIMKMNISNYKCSQFLQIRLERNNFIIFIINIQQACYEQHQKMCRPPIHIDRYRKKKKLPHAKNILFLFFIFHLQHVYKGEVEKKIYEQMLHSIDIFT